MRVIYMGTPEFAVLPLKSISAAGHEVIAVFTQPDRQKGRGKKVSFSEVKQAAIELGLEDKIYQPDRLRDEESVKVIRDLQPDIIVVAAYGQILSEEILNIPKLGCINIHASLLPLYRGASPVESAIIDGREKTGVTIMYMAKGLDTGDMISKAEVEITADDNTETLTAKLSEAGAELVVKTMAELEAGTAERVPQKDEDSCYAGKLSKEMGKLDFTQPAVKLERLIRGLYPWPCAYTYLDSKSIKLIKADVTELPEDSSFTEPGMIAAVTKKNFTIACGEGALVVRMLQPEGKKTMETVAFLNGYKLEPGTKLGE